MKIDAGGHHLHDCMVLRERESEEVRKGGGEGKRGGASHFFASARVGGIYGGTSFDSVLINLKER